MMRRVFATMLGWWDGLRSRWKTFGAILFGLFVIFVWTPFHPHAAYNERLTITVMTPDGPVSGSSVIRSEHSLSPQISMAGGYTVDVFGEATVVDLGEGRYLFGLLGLHAKRAYEAAGRVGRFDRDRFRWYFFKLKYLSSHEPVPVAPKNFPRFVTFADINDPKSVALVDPDDLAASFGEGYALESTEVNLTRGPVTRGVVKGALRWLATNEEWIVAPATATNEKAVLANGQFDSEWNK